MITEEGRQLRQHWDRKGPATLDRYLVQDVEHPVYNAQSVLVRGLLAERLCQGTMPQLVEEELYFSVCACFGLAALRRGEFADLFERVASRCRRADLPAFLRHEARARLGGRFDLPGLLEELQLRSTSGFDGVSSPFASAWRQWLAAHHADVSELWLVYHKAHTRVPNVPYGEAVEEALCFGWVDSIIKRLDEDTYARKFTPRRPESRWSELNKDRATRMIEAGRMTPVGLALIEHAKASGE